MPEDKKDYLQLPVSVVSRVDVGRLLREVEALNNFMAQTAIRQPGTQVKPPKTSRLMDEMLSTNKLNLLVEKDRGRLDSFLKDVRDHAPMLHMSFNADPAPMFMQKLTRWVRSELHPIALIQVGLQPNIGAGCIVRSTNKYFDFSLRQHFLKQRELLMKKMRGIEGVKPAAATATPQAAPSLPSPAAHAQEVHK